MNATAVVIEAVRLKLALQIKRIPKEQAIVVFREPGTRNEHELAELSEAGGVTKPIVALLAGQFQERYQKGQSFGHAAAMISSEEDSVTAKKKQLIEAGMAVADSLDEIPVLLKEMLKAKSNVRA
jgi:succinyl-CoA synthetase alpha subunit